MIEVRDLRFHFPRSGFRLDLDALRIVRGERVAILGTSGCGKTTFLHLLAGIQMPAHGQIRVAGSEIHRMPDRDRRAFRVSQIGFVFQDFELIDYLHVLDNILLPYRLNAARLRMCAAVLERAEHLADLSGIKHRLRAFPQSLSQGEKQRVAICRALLPQPPLLLADEPTGNLDPSTRDAIMDLLMGQVAETGATLVMVTHDNSLANRFMRCIDLRELLA
jgi:ABC-type lipoprotein export system ATPase subunit